MITLFEDNPEQEALLEAMSDAERRAWDHALWGGMLYEGVFDPEAGCRPRAQESVWRFSVHQAFGAVQSELGQLHERAGADPRLVAAHRDWASCIADAGHPDLTTPQDLQFALSDAWWNVQPQASVAELLEWDFEAHPGGPPVPPIDPAVTARFTEREIAAAVADFDCRQEARVDVVRTEVLLELQRDFVERFGPELEAWATAVETP